MSSFRLPNFWVKFEILDGLPIYYDWRHQNFSLSPVLDIMSFLTVVNHLMATKFKKGEQTELKLQDLQNKISELESQIKLQNKGVMPSEEALQKQDLSYKLSSLLKEKNPKPDLIV